jgi:nitroimidazol reductase NimA-like FMN-containing flavoprotein (pyridoxamine 5'-phosphate oxidase superfamily)
MSESWAGNVAKVAHLDEQLLRERLHRARVARIGYVDGEGPVVVPINVAVDEDERIVFRTAVDGPLATLDGQRVAIEIDGIDPPRRSGWSILVRGVARDVTDASDAVAALAQTVPVDCWAPGARDRTFVVLPQGVTGRVIPVGPDGDWFASLPS